MHTKIFFGFVLDVSASMYFWVLKREGFEIADCKVPFAVSSLYSLLLHNYWPVPQFNYFGLSPRIEQVAKVSEAGRARTRARRQRRSAPAAAIVDLLHVNGMFMCG